MNCSKSRLIAIFLSVVCVFFLNSKSPEKKIAVKHPSAKCQNGSGTELDGKIVIVSIFANDIKTSWGRERVPEYTLKTTEYLKIATEWITKSVKKYGASPEFVYDYFSNGGIYYRATFNVDMRDWTKNDAEVWKYIENNINIKWIKNNYKTDNIIFLVYLNTELNNTFAPAARSHYDGMPSTYEIVYMNRYRKGWESPPSSYAHEILHLFGAKDLYYGDVRNGFPAEFIDYCARNHKNDIMLTISDVKEGGVHYDRITNELTDLDAYYLGLKNSCKEMEKFSLPKSEHF